MIGDLLLVGGGLWIVDCGLWSKQTESSVSFLTLSPPTSFMYTLPSVKEVLVHAGIIIFDQAFFLVQAGIIIIHQACSGITKGSKE